MGRKRNKGKARKAAKAKAREAAEEDYYNNYTANGRQQPLGAQMQQLQMQSGAAPIPPQRVGRGGYNQQPQPRAPAYGMMPPPQQQMIGQGGGLGDGLGFLPQNLGEPIRYSFADEYGNVIGDVIDVDATGDALRNTAARNRKVIAFAQKNLLQSISGHDTTKCWHGSIESIDVMCIEFVIAFREAFYSSAKDKESGGIDGDISDLLVDAGNATLDEFAAVWNDSSKMEMAMSYFLYYGTQNILEGTNNLEDILELSRDDTRHCAIFARYFEQYIAVKLDQTQAIMHWPKLYEADRGDMHTLVKFFRTRCPCACLDGKYDEVKAITKLGFCFNPECNSNFDFEMSGELERSKTKYCSRCRCATYCSRECQKADWTRHKIYCDEDAEEMADFDAKTKKKRPNAP
eukprot:scaffold4462_cov119-Skeletonema_dohrnii-CCMP3373.AAC.2